MNKFKTRHVDRHLYVNFLKRAEECLSSAVTSLEKKDHMASAICSVHSAIAAADALCVYFLQLKHAGYDHKDAVRLLETIKAPDKDRLKDACNRLGRILAMKGMAEYEERLVKPKEAEKLGSDAAAVLEFAGSILPKQ